MQEFIDPLALTIGAGTKLARGSTVYGFGDTIIGKGGVVGRSIIQPSKVVTFGKTVSKEQLTNRVVTERVDRLVGNVEKGIPANKRIENLFRLMDDVDLESTNNRMQLTGVPSTADDFAAIDRRAGVLRENMSRRGSLEMPAEAIAFIARGNTDAARKLNFRIALGDMNALNEAKVVASDAVQILNDNDFFVKIETINNLSKQIARDQTNLGKLDATTIKGREATQKANVRISERQAELSRLTAEISQQQTTLTSVDWGSVYDFDLALKRSTKRNNDSQRIWFARS